MREKTDSRRGGAAAPDDEGPFCMLHLYSSRRVLPDQANLVVDEIKKEHFGGDGRVRSETD